MIHGLDLFSGYGGISLALSDWVRPLAYCEIERYAQGVLLSRISEGLLPAAPIWDDVRTFPSEDFRGAIDIIYGGFPCQDISVAGAGKGLEGERSGLFYEVCRLVKELNPSFVFLENVPAIRTRGLRTVIRELTTLGYDCRWTCVSASEVGAPHIRKRWFLLAADSHGKSVRDVEQRLPGRREGGVSDKRENEPRNHGESKYLADSCKRRGALAHSGGSGNRTELSSMGREEKAGESKPTLSPSSSCTGLANSNGEGLQRYGERILRAESEKPWACERSGWWEVEPDVGRVVDGCSFRVDRIKALGNGVVPAQAKVAFQRLLNLN